MGDLMHTGCLGVVGYALGSALHEIVFGGTLTKSPAKSLDAIWEMIQAEYVSSNTQHRLTSLTFGMFYHGSAEWADLSCRAAEARALVPVVKRILQVLHDGSDHAEHRLRAIASLETSYDIVMGADM